MPRLKCEDFVLVVFDGDKPSGFGTFLRFKLGFIVLLPYASEFRTLLSFLVVKPGLVLVLLKSFPYEDIEFYFGMCLKTA